jgi:hypothetical protein
MKRPSPMTEHHPDHCPSVKQPSSTGARGNSSDDRGAAAKVTEVWTRLDRSVGASA